MSQLEQLRKEAETAHNNHKIEWAAPWHGESRSIQSGVCKNCGFEFCVATKRFPNENTGPGGYGSRIPCCHHNRWENYNEGGTNGFN